MHAPGGPAPGGAVVRLDGERMEDFRHEAAVEPGRHILEAYHFISNWGKVPPPRGVLNRHRSPMRIELDAKTGHIYTILGDETWHEIVDSSNSRSTE